MGFSILIKLAFSVAFVKIVEADTLDLNTRNVNVTSPIYGQTSSNVSYGSNLRNHGNFSGGGDDDTGPPSAAIAGPVGSLISLIIIFLCCRYWCCRRYYRVWTDRNNGGTTNVTVVTNTAHAAPAPASNTNIINNFVNPMSHAAAAGYQPLHNQYPPYPSAPADVPPPYASTVIRQ